MSRKVRRKVTRRGKEKLDYPEVEECLLWDDKDVVDWTKLPDDTALQLFSCLNYRDRASLSSTCRTWRILGASPCLWQVLDIRRHKCDAEAAASLASRCRDLQNLRFRGAESADSIINLQARNLREISGDYCRKISDATLSVIAARHEKLESLQLGPDFCERISSDAIKALAICCGHLQKLRLSGIREIDSDAINALARNCPNLVDVGFIDCLRIDEVALANVSSVRFLSAAGIDLPHSRSSDLCSRRVFSSTIPDLMICARDVSSPYRSAARAAIHRSSFFVPLLSSFLQLPKGPKQNFAPPVSHPCAVARSHWSTFVPPLVAAGARLCRRS